MSTVNYLAQAEAELIVETLLADIALKANSADLATVATTGAYSDLSGTPTLATVATTGAYADLTGKPTLATVATSGSYTDLTDKPTIPTVDSSYSASSTNAQSGVAVAEAIATVTTTSIGAVPTSLVGANSGVAQLDSNGKVPSSQLPSYVDDIVEGYLYNGTFYEDAQHTTAITGETGKIYVDLSTNKTYRWSGSVYVEISESLALGETSSTAFAGDRGVALETAMNGLADVATSGDYDDLTNKPSIPTAVSDLTNDLNFVESSDLATVATTGDYSDLSNTPTIPSAVSDLTNDLGFVESSDLATVATSGSYNDLSNKPTIPTVDQSYSASSANAQSGVAIAGALSNYVLETDLVAVPRATVESWLGIESE
jgi:hypothetical protein